jgi:hypothetical protein
VYRYDNAVEAVQWMPSAECDALSFRPTMLISAGADGILRIWRVGPEGHLMCTMEGAVGPMDTVRSMCTDHSKEYLAISDSSGHTKLLHAPSIDPALPEATAASFSQVCACLEAQVVMRSMSAVVHDRLETHNSKRGSDAMHNALYFTGVTS